MRRRRLAAIAALALAAASVVVAVVLGVQGFPRGLSVLACALLALAAAWYGLRRRGLTRVAGLGAAVLLVAASAALVVREGDPIPNLLVLVGLGLAAPAAGAAFRVHVRLPAAPAPQHPVLFFNPKSGGGKAERFRLADEARARGIEPVELRRGMDLGSLVREALETGADALAMAGGDGSQAVVAAIAAERGLPYACIPAGTRNHFALDLGVDRDDVVGALDAFVDGGERRVDLAEVNGRVFVNNVSLGIYAEAVQRDEYRDAKLRTILDTVPEMLGPDSEALDLRWTGPDGSEEHSKTAILISNNRYRLGSAIASGTRPRLDAGRLGVAVVDVGSAGDRGRPRPRGPWRDWSTPSFQVESDEPVAAGVDGEAVRLDPPLHFRSLPGALRVRISRRHPGASPSARLPDSGWSIPGMLMRIALGGDPPAEARHG